jgi:hypothetical protein
MTASRTSCLLRAFSSKAALIEARLRQLHVRAFDIAGAESCAACRLGG